MTDAPSVALGASLALALYPYLGYPALLELLSLIRRTPASGGGAPRATPGVPFVSITIPAYNEASSIAGTLEHILALDYPAERRQILVVSDASSDGTDDIVAGYAARGVELLRLPRRAGKSAGENAARALLRGDVIVNIDASMRIHPGAIAALVAALANPAVGVASGRDVSVARLDAATQGEGTYVGYEMWVRDLETRLGGIVGASGCLYAIRAELHREHVPDNLSRDFAAALIARRRGFRAVSVPGAVCYVPRGTSLRQEYRRKVRTMARGLRTLWHFRALLNPARYGAFAWMLASHKLARWLAPWALVGAFGAVGVLAVGNGLSWAWVLLGGATVAGALALAGWLWPAGRPAPRILALPAYVVSGTIAALHAWLFALRGRRTAVWEPTRRSSPSPAP